MTEAALQETAQHKVQKVQVVVALLWRRRVEVESTIPSAKDGIAGFEGRGSHRTPFASG